MPKEFLKPLRRDSEQWIQPIKKKRGYLLELFSHLKNNKGPTLFTLIKNTQALLIKTKNKMGNLCSSPEELMKNFKKPKFKEPREDLNMHTDSTVSFSGRLKADWDYKQPDIVPQLTKLRGFNFVSPEFKTCRT